MGDIDEGGAGLNMKALELISHFQPKLGIQVRQRFVHKENAWLGSKGSGYGHSLLLTATELSWISIHEHSDLYYPGYSPDSKIDLLTAHLSAFNHHLSVFRKLEGGIQMVLLHAFLHLGTELADFLAHILSLFKVIGEQGLCCKLADSEGVNKLQYSSLAVNLAILVTALLQYPYHFLRIFKDLHQLAIGPGIEVYLRHLLLDVCKAKGDILIYSHVWPKGIVLEEEAHLSLVGRNIDASRAIEDHFVANGDLTACRSLKACNHSQCGGLSAT